MFTNSSTPASKMSVLISVLVLSTIATTMVASVGADAAGNYTETITISETYSVGGGGYHRKSITTSTQAPTTPGPAPNANNKTATISYTTSLQGPTTAPTPGPGPSPKNGTITKSSTKTVNGNASTPAPTPGPGPSPKNGTITSTVIVMLTRTLTANPAPPSPGPNPQHTPTRTMTLLIQPTSAPTTANTTTSTTATTTSTTTTAAPLPNEVKFSVQGSNYTAYQIRDQVAIDLNISSASITVVSDTNGPVFFSDVANGTTRYVVLAFSTSSYAASALQRANDGALSSVGITGASAVAPSPSPSPDDDGDNTGLIVGVVVGVVAAVVLVGVIGFVVYSKRAGGTSKMELEMDNSDLVLPRNENV